MTYKFRKACRKLKYAFQQVIIDLAEEMMFQQSMYDRGEQWVIEQMRNSTSEEAMLVRANRISNDLISATGKFKDKAFRDGCRDALCDLKIHGYKK